MKRSEATAAGVALQAILAGVLGDGMSAATEPSPDGLAALHKALRAIAGHRPPDATLH